MSKQDEKSTKFAKRGKGLYCVVPGCNINNLSDPTCQLFKFPVDECMRNVWLSTMGLEQNTLKNLRVQVRVCAKHFKTKHIGKKKLKQIAIPTLHMPEVQHKYTIIGPSRASPTHINELLEKDVDNAKQEDARPPSEELEEAVNYEDVMENEANGKDDQLPPEELQEAVNYEVVMEDEANEKDDQSQPEELQEAVNYEVVLENDAKENDDQLPPEVLQDDVCYVEDMGNDTIGTESDIEIILEECGETTEVDNLEEKINQVYQELTEDEHFELMELEAVEPTNGIDDITDDIEVIASDPCESETMTSTDAPNAKDEKVKIMPSGQLCIVPLCKTSYRDGPSARMFKFPSSERDRRLWLAALGLSESVVKCLSVPRVCYKHFEPKLVGKKRLKQDAVPTLNLRVTTKRTKAKLEDITSQMQGEHKEENNESLTADAEPKTVPGKQNAASKKRPRESDKSICTRTSCKNDKKLQRSVYGDQYEKLKKRWEQTKQNQVKLYKRLRILNVSIGKQKELGKKFFVESRNRKMGVVLRDIKGLSESSRSMCSMLLKKGINWHDEEKNLALCLYSSSPKMYFNMRNHLKMNLPSKSSLIRWNQVET